MPPKKVEEPERKPLIGRVGTNLRVGIVGVPNVGKSTFFNVLTKSQAAAENFPFCTIDPNENKMQNERKSNIRFSTFTASKLDIPLDLTYAILGDEHYKAVQRFLLTAETKELLTLGKRQHYISKGTGFCTGCDSVEEDDDSSLNKAWRPKANITYGQLECTDPSYRLDKIASFSNESREESSSQESVAPLEVQKPIALKNYYSHESARINYLKSKPNCFVILGKGGIGEIGLGKHLSNLWKCVYIDPETVIQDEIKKNTREGLCLKYSLKLGRSIHPDIIMKLIEKRVRSREVQHRGYIIVGIPIIPSDLVEPVEVNMVTESTVFNVEYTVHDMMEGAIIAAAVNNRDKRLKEEEERKEQAKLLALEKTKAKKDVDDDEDEEDPEEEELEDELGEEEEEAKKSPEIIEDDYTILPESTEFNEENLYNKGSSTNISVDMRTSKTFCAEDTTKSQLNSLFNLPYKPDIIIYISCPDEDVIIKRSMCEYYDDEIARKSDLPSDLYEEGASEETTEYTSLKSDEDIVSYESDYNQVRDTKYEEDFDDAPKVIIKALKDKNDPISVRIQIERYTLHALPIIEKYMLLHDPQYVIRVDGRTTLADMFETTATKLRTLPLQTTFIPERFFEAVQPEISKKLVKGEDEPQHGAEEGEPEPEELGGEGGGTYGPKRATMFDGLSPDECLTKLCTMMKISPMYNWLKTDWTTYCPVSLKEGKLLHGNPELAVKFMDSVYIMSSEEALEKFILNPRIYLLPPQPMPGCRIFIVGPNYSGKSSVAAFLSYLYNGHVINIEDIKLSWRRRKIFKVLFAKYKELFIRARDIVTERRKQEWLRLEQERKDKIKAFKAETISYIKELFMLRKFAGDCVNIDCDCCVCKYSLPTHTLAEIQEYFDKHAMPFFHDLELCLRVKLDTSLLDEYIPEDIAIQFPEPAQVQFEDDEVLDIVIANLEDPTEIDRIQVEDEDYGPMLAETIKLADKKRCEESNNKIKFGGWIIDSVPFIQSAWEELYDQQIFADDVVILRDEDTENTFLKDKLRSGRFRKFKDFENLFLSMNNEIAAERCPSIHSTASSLYYKMYDIVKDILDSELFTHYHQKNEESLETDFSLVSSEEALMLQEFEEHLNDFEQKYHKALQFFADLYFEPVVVNIHEKADVLVMEMVMNQIRNKYKQKAEDYIEENVEQELKDIAAEYLNENPDVTEPVPMDEGGGEDDMGNGEEEGEDDANKLAENRRLGDTNKYCPVVYHEYGSLWPGMEQYMAKFRGKIYLFSSEKAKEKFMNNPYTYAPYDKFPSPIPPLRICIFGPYGSGKTTYAKQIARNFGLHYVNYLQLLYRLYFPEPLPGRENTKWFIENTTEEMFTHPDEMYQILQRYINEGVPLDQDKVIKALNRVWYQEPYVSEGVVLDGFPFRASDITPQIESCAIPDVYVELTTSADEAQIRQFDKIFEGWLNTLNDKREELNEENTRIITERTIIRDRIFKSEFKKLKKKKFSEIKEPYETEEEGDYPDILARGESNIIHELADFRTSITISKSSFDSKKSITDDFLVGLTWDTIDKDISELNMHINEKYPMPPIKKEEDCNWESEQSARLRIAQQIQSWFEFDYDAIDEIKEHILENSIPWLQIQTNKRTQANIVNEIMFKLLPYKNRTNSYFERTYVTTLVKAENLLNTGYYLLSRFGKMCPVQLYERVNPILMFLPLEKKNEIYPVIHRQYIYFLAGQTNMEKFRKDPLTYIDAKNEDVPLYPVKISIIGPPKCGKTTIAERFAKEFGMKVINKPDSVAYVLDKLAWTRLAMDINEEQALRSDVSAEFVFRAVIAATSDKYCITQGFILDGFPCNIDELEELVMGDIIPYIFIDLRANLQVIMERNSQCSCVALACSYDGWCVDQPDLRYFIDEEFQNIYMIQANQSKWEMWSEARDAVYKVMTSVQQYCNRVNKDLPASLEYLCITPYEFQHRVGEYKTYCPVCYSKSEILNTTGSLTPDRKGLVQYLNSYYWICDNHMKNFMEDPSSFFPPYSNELPADLPRRPTDDDKQDEWHEKLYGDGYDLVAMTDGQPSRVMIAGSSEYALMYKDQVYYFVNEENLLKFLKAPHDYFDKMCDFQSSRPLPDLDCNNLPVLGYLQQTQTILVTQAVLATGRLRPKYPGLDAILSATIYMGYFLKLNNPETPSDILAKHSEAMNIFLKGLDWLKEKVNYFKENLNPFVRLPLFKKKPEPEPKIQMFVPRLPPECYDSTK